MNIEFASKVPSTARRALEELLFFNPGQRAMADSIAFSVERYGAPRIVAVADGLSIQLGKRDAQALFAFDRDHVVDVPFAVAIYTRPSVEEISLVHVAVHPDYCQQSRRAGLGLGVMIIAQIRRIAAQITGVQRIEFAYRQRSLAVPRQHRRGPTTTYSLVTAI